MSAEEEYEEYIPVSLRDKDYIHSPTLQTVVMIEETIKKLDYYPNKTELKKELPRKVQHQTLNIVLNYLKASGKIIFDKRQIVWIWDPEFVKSYLKKNKDLIVR